eukprot:gene933-1809_t
MAEFRDQSNDDITATTLDNEVKNPYFQKLTSTLLFPSMDVDALKEHIESHAEFFRNPTKNGWLPIHYACMAGSFDIVSVMLTAFPESVKIPQHEGLLPLHLSVYGTEPCISTLELLLDKYPEGALHKSKDGKTPLHLCLYGKSRPSAAAVEILVQRCPHAASICTNFGKMPLHLCADSDTPCLKSMKLLLEAFPEAARHQDDFPYRRLPLHYILMRTKCKPSVEAVELLLEAFPDGASQGEQHGKSPLHVAVGYESSLVCLDIVTRLLDACPSALRSRCVLGRLPVMDLVDRDEPCTKALQALLYAGSSIRSTLLLTDRSGNTALHFATARAIPNLKVVRMLISAEPVAASIRNHLESLPLHDFLEVAEPEAEEALLAVLDAHTMAASQTNAKGWLPLHLAAHRPRPCISLIKRLLKLYPEGSYHSSQQGQWLPIHCAVGRSAPSCELVSLLLDAYPDGAAVKCSLGLTPLGCVLAQSQPSYDVIVPLLQ